MYIQLTSQFYCGHYLQFDGESGLWEDEDTKMFYENLKDLKASLPGVNITCLVRLILYVVVKELFSKIALFVELAQQKRSDIRLDTVVPNCGTSLSLRVFA